MCFNRNTSSLFYYLFSNKTQTKKGFKRRLRNAVVINQQQGACLLKPFSQLHITTSNNHQTREFIRFHPHKDVEEGEKERRNNICHYEIFLLSLQA